MNRYTRKYHLTDEKEASHESATLEAKGRYYGIGSWPMDYSHAGWAVRLIDEPSYPEPGQAAAIPPVTGSPEENLVVIMDLS